MKRRVGDRAPLDGQVARKDSIGTGVGVQALARSSYTDTFLGTLSQGCYACHYIFPLNILSLE